MAISFTRYVDIVSGVGAAESVAERELIARLVTDNVLVPPGTLVEFTTAADVGTYFGFSSNEYLRASFYFAWVSKNITQAQKIGFWRWVDTAQAGVVYGKKATYSLSSFTSVSSGHLNLTIGTHTTELTGINLSAAGSLATVAADIQTAIRAYSTGGADFTAATVTYDATAGRFILTGGVAGPEVMAILPVASGTDVGGLLGWLTGAIVGQGSAVETITQTLTTSAATSNNFGSFLFMPSLNLSQITEAATWNDGQNLLFQYMVPVTASNSAATSAALINLAGNAMTLSPLTAEYPEMIPMMIMAATDYTARNSVQNYMFQIFDVTPSVTDDADADTYDALRVNYYGQTQTAGQFIQFYQRGILTGQAQDPIDQNVYANEQWFKDAIGSQLMQLLLALAQVPANKTGQAQLLAVIQSVINQALFNGTISVGKPLTVTQQLYVTNATGSNTAWQQVQTIGYWVNVVIQPFVEDSVTHYKAVYTLIYSKDDVIRKVEGSDILI